MKGLMTCPNCLHVLGIDVQRHKKGSKQGLLLTRIGDKHEKLLAKWLSHPLVFAEKSEDDWHQLLAISTDRAFSGRISELLAIDVVQRKELKQVSRYDDAMAGRSPHPLVVYKLDIAMAVKTLQLKDGLKANCERCSGRRAITLGSLLEDKRVCKKCVQTELDSTFANIIVDLGRGPCQAA